MALVAGPPRRDENKERSSPWSDVGFAWCSQRARTRQCDAGASQAPQTVALEHEHQTLSRRGSSRRRPHFHIRLASSTYFVNKVPEDNLVAPGPARVGVVLPTL